MAANLAKLKAKLAALEEEGAPEHMVLFEYIPYISLICHQYLESSNNLTCSYLFSLSGSNWNSEKKSVNVLW